MIVDLRIYTCKPNKMAEFVKIYEELAWPLQEKYLGRNLGWFTTIEGELNTVVHIWGYENQADREARRNAMAADPAGQAGGSTGAGDEPHAHLRKAKDGGGIGYHLSGRRGDLDAAADGRALDIDGQSRAKGGD